MIAEARNRRLSRGAERRRYFEEGALAPGLRESER